jgi:DNA-directed RNA polymerase specialized sigma24 family protein
MHEDRGAAVADWWQRTEKTRSWIVRRSASPAEREDLEQTIAEIAIRQWPAPADGRVSLTVWLRRAVARYYRSTRGQSKHRPVVLPLPATVRHELRMREPGPAELAAAGDLEAQCLRCLSEKQRTVVEELLAGQSLSDAAERHGITTATAHARLRNARRRCAQLFAGPRGLPKSRGRGGSQAGTRGGGRRLEPPR